jgi:hypothetical protein
MTEITQAARDFEEAALRERGSWDIEPLRYAFQRAIDHGRAQALEEAAKDAKRLQEIAKEILDAHFGSAFSRTTTTAAAQIAGRFAAIRALADRERKEG